MEPRRHSDLGRGMLYDSGELTSQWRNNAYGIYATCHVSDSEQ